MTVNYRSVESCNCTAIDALRRDLHNSKPSFVAMKCGEMDKILPSVMVASGIALISTVSQSNLIDMLFQNINVLI